MVNRAVHGLKLKEPPCNFIEVIFVNLWKKFFVFDKCFQNKRQSAANLSNEAHSEYFEFNRFDGFSIVHF